MRTFIFVHGYGLNETGGLGKESLVIVAETCKLYEHSPEKTTIILLGGWDESNKKRGEPIAEIMRRDLVDRGVPGEAIKSWKDFFPEELGPRDTLEEIGLAKKISEMEKGGKLCAISTWSSTLRIELLYKRAGMRVRVIPVWAGENPWEILIQTIFLGITLFYPRFGTRALIEKNRERRTPQKS